MWAIDPHLAPLWTDPGKLKTVLKNLLGNAIKFTRAGRIIVATSAQTGGVAVSISDTGPGIPPEALALIFESFRQLDSSITRFDRGVGLGLSSGQSFLGLLGGQITVESEVGCGSTFRVWLPHGRVPVEQRK